MYINIFIQEVQAVLGWAKNPTTISPHPTLAEIQVGYTD